MVIFWIINHISLVPSPLTSEQSLILKFTCIVLDVKQDIFSCHKNICQFFLSHWHFHAYKIYWDVAFCEKMGVAVIIAT